MYIPQKVNHQSNSHEMAWIVVYFGGSKSLHHAPFMINSTKYYVCINEEIFVYQCKQAVNITSLAHGWRIYTIPNSTHS